MFQTLQQMDGLDDTSGLSEDAIYQGESVSHTIVMETSGQQYTDSEEEDDDNQIYDRNQ